MSSVASSATAGSTVVNREADAVLASIARVAGLVADAREWPTVDRRGLLGRLDRAFDSLGAVRAAVLLAERESGAWKGAGDRSFEAWRGRTSGAGDRAATAQVRQAEHLGAVPSVTAAATTGQITLAHAAAIGRVAATGSPAQQAAVTDPTAQAQLIALAQGQDAATFATTVARLAATIDPDALERDYQAQRAARFLHLADTPRGTVIKGQVDTMAGHRLRLALEALSSRPGADDDREPGQRRADALDAMATGVLSDPRTTPGAHVPPHVSLVLTETTWHAARTERDRRRATQGHTAAAGATSADASAREDGPPAPAATPANGREHTSTSAGAGENTDTAATAPEAPAVGGYEPARFEDGTPVPASELARVLCDCEVTRIAIDADGAPLDLGRTQRLFSGPQRRAVIARDRECVWPDCHAPARWCDIHHCDWWDRDDGHTRVDRGVLLCTFHHHETHRRDLTITRDMDPPDSHRNRGRPASTLARVRYELRDRTGRLIGQPSGGTTGAAAARTGREPPDQLDRQWVTDPITGMNVPGFLVGSPQ